MYISLLFLPWFVVLVFGLHYAFSHLSGWRTLARSWLTPRSKLSGSRLACFAEVDWTWSYRWNVEVRVLETGIHCQPRAFFALTIPLPFHPPLLVPWSDISEFKLSKDWSGPSLEVRARTRKTDFRICYPRDLGFPAERWQAARLAAEHRAKTPA